MSAAPEEDMTAPVTLEGLYRTGKIRIRANRLPILKVMDEACEPLPSKDVWSRASAAGTGISLSTILRTLRDLCDAGVVHRTIDTDGTIYYVRSCQLGRDHLVDVEDGGVVQFQDARLQEVLRNAAAALGYDLESYRLEIFGRRIRRDVAGLASLGRRKSGLVGLMLFALNTLDLPWLEYVSLFGVAA